MIVPIVRTIIADDESLARKKLRMLLGAETSVQILAECQDGKEAIEAVLTHKPDLVLLDVQMPNGDGFEVLRNLPADSLPIIVFTTAYDQYAIRAFDAHALDYLLKPFNQERLHRSIERVKLELLKSYDQGVRARILDLLNGTKTESRQFRRLVVRTSGRVVFLDLNEIDWIEAAANYVRLHSGKDSYLLREGIGHLAAKLDPDRFVRIHRSSIVNVSRIRELQPCESGEYIAVLRNGKELSCSRGCRPQLLRLIQGRI